MITNYLEDKKKDERAHFYPNFFICSMKGIIMRHYIDPNATAFSLVWPRNETYSIFNRTVDKKCNSAYDIVLCSRKPIMKYVLC